MGFWILWENDQKFRLLGSSAPLQGLSSVPRSTERSARAAQPLCLVLPGPLCSSPPLSGPREALSLLPWECYQKPTLEWVEVRGLTLLS